MAPTALQVGKPYFPFPGEHTPALAQFLCGSFTGPGSEAMLIAFGAPTCWPIQGFAVFSRSGGQWHLVLRRSDFVEPPLVAVGSDIRETSPVYRAGDPRCLPSGGTHARVWHWNGTQLAAGPWRQVKKGAARTPSGTARTRSGYLRTPSGNIECDYSYRPGSSYNYVRCGVRSGLVPPPPTRGAGCTTPSWLTLRATGQAALEYSTCPGEDAHDAGPYAPLGVARQLGYGHSWSSGGLRCASATSGLTCRNPAGHGFFLSRSSWRAF